MKRGEERKETEGGGEEVRRGAARAQATFYSYVYYYVCVCVWDSGWKSDCSREYVNVCVKARWKEPSDMGKTCSVV